MAIFSEGRVEALIVAWTKVLRGAPTAALPCRCAAAAV